jgi:hypothetical protein
LVELVHDTLLRPLLALPGFGLEAVVHVLPFQDSTRVWNTPDAFAEVPTATQLVGLVHDTPLSKLSELSGFGLGTTVQALPFQDSTKVL